MSRNRGATLTELMVASAIMGIIVIGLVGFYNYAARSLVATDTKSQADVSLRFAFSKVETALLNTNSFEVATSTFVQFIADLTTDDGYSETADPDGDGIINIQDPDDDNDATLVQPSTAQWKIGYDLKDDDDDNDNQVDMRWRIYTSTNARDLFLDYSKNGEAWGGHVSKILSQMISTSVFTFYGSKDDLLLAGGAALDTNGDGLVSFSEMDTSGNGFLDTSAERNRITAISVSLDRDGNGDGKADGSLSLEVLPPSLYLKRRP